MFYYQAWRSAGTELVSYERSTHGTVNEAVTTAVARSRGHAGGVVPVVLLTAVRLITVLDYTYCTSLLKNPSSHKPVVTASFVQLVPKSKFCGEITGKSAGDEEEGAEGSPPGNCCKCMP